MTLQRRVAATRGLAVLAALAGAGAPARAQDMRGWVGTTVQLVELREVAGDTTSSAKVRTVAASQDLNLTAWGFGVQGLSATTMLRTRQRRGGELAWPRSGDEFDLMLAYGQLLRGPVRVRLGRQEIVSGLGFPAFDGGSLEYRVGPVRLEGYGGRSLARGLREPANTALRGLEDFLPDRSVVLLGGSVGARARGVSMVARYHREILSDRSGLDAERAAIDFTAALPRARLIGSLDYDFGQGRFGKGHLTAAAPLGDGRWWVEASARRYVPYFALSTIWGFFEPVAYEEAAARVAWSWTPELGVWASGGLRRYHEAAATVVLSPLQDVGRRAGGGVRWTPPGPWSADATYALEWGPGGFLSSVDGAARWAVSPTVSLSGSISSFQQFEEFRLGEGRAIGLGASGDVALGARTSFVAGASVLRHSRGSGAPWNQGRAWTSLRIAIGDDPGMARPTPGRGPQ